MRLRRVALLLAMSALGFGLAFGDALADPLGEGARAYAAQHFVRAERLLRPLAERGDVRAQTTLGVMALRGQGTTQNYVVAAQWLHSAASAGEPAAQYFLGLLYDRGLGVDKDHVLAEAWLNLAVAHAAPGWRERWTRIRDAVAMKLSRADIAEAQRLAAQADSSAPNP